MDVNDLKLAGAAGLLRAVTPGVLPFVTLVLPVHRLCPPPLRGQRRVLRWSNLFQTNLSNYADSHPAAPGVY